MYCRVPKEEGGVASRAPASTARLRQTCVSPVHVFRLSPFVAIDTLMVICKERAEQPSKSANTAPGPCIPAASARCRAAKHDPSLANLLWSEPMLGDL